MLDEAVCPRQLRLNRRRNPGKAEISFTPGNWFFFSGPGWCHSNTLSQPLENAFQVSLLRDGGGGGVEMVL